MWQARLVLELGTVLDEEAEALRRELAAIRARERSLFASLHGREAEEEPSMALTWAPSQADDDPASERLLRLRLRAWSRFYCAGAGNTRPDDLLVTDRLLIQHFLRHM